MLAGSSVSGRISSVAPGSLLVRGCASTRAGRNFNKSDRPCRPRCGGCLDPLDGRAFRRRPDADSASARPPRPPRPPGGPSRHRASGEEPGASASGAPRCRHMTSRQASIGPKPVARARLGELRLEPERPVGIVVPGRVPDRDGELGERDWQSAETNPSAPSSVDEANQVVAVQVAEVRAACARRSASRASGSGSGSTSLQPTIRGCSASFRSGRSSTGCRSRGRCRSPAAGPGCRPGPGSSRSPRRGHRLIPGGQGGVVVVGQVVEHPGPGQGPFGPLSETFRTSGTRPCRHRGDRLGDRRQARSGIRSKRAVVPRIQRPWTPAWIWKSTRRAGRLDVDRSSSVKGVGRGGTMPCRRGRSMARAPRSDSMKRRSPLSMAEPNAAGSTRRSTKSGPQDRSAIPDGSRLRNSVMGSEHADFEAQRSDSLLSRGKSADARARSKPMFRLVVEPSLRSRPILVRRSGGTRREAGAGMRLGLARVAGSDGASRPRA